MFARLAHAKHKVLIGVAASAAVVALAGGAAFAYYEIDSPGTGTGSLTIDTPPPPATITIQQCSQVSGANCPDPVTDLALGTPQIVDLYITDNSSTQAAYVGNIATSLSVTNGDSNQLLPACTASMFSVPRNSFEVDQTLQPGTPLIISGANAPSVTLVNESTTDQTNCQGAKVVLTFTAT